MLEAKFAPAKPQSREMITKTLNGVEAVSYTHLDVYKRQPASCVRFRLSI